MFFHIHVAKSECATKFAKNEDENRNQSVTLCQAQLLNRRPVRSFICVVTDCSLGFVAWPERINCQDAYFNVSGRPQPTVLLFLTSQRGRVITQSSGSQPGPQGPLHFPFVPVLHSVRRLAQSDVFHLGSTQP